jgi:hypothetical protein
MSVLAGCGGGGSSGSGSSSSAPGYFKRFLVARGAQLD